MAKTWGVPGKRQTYLSPGEQIANMPKVPLNANPLNAWDYKKSRYARVDLYPKAVSDNTQQGGVIPVVSGPTPPSYFQFTVTSGATAQDACSSLVTFTIYTEVFDDSACSADLSGWACIPQGVISAFSDPELTIEIGNGFYASEYQTGVIGSYEFAGAFSNFSICVEPTPTPTMTPSATPNVCMEIGNGFSGSTDVRAAKSFGSNIFVGGGFGSYSGVAYNRIVGLSYNGSVNNSFNVGNGITGSSSVITMSIQSDGKLLLGGSGTGNYNGTTTRGFFRVNTDGTYDSTFAPGAFSTSPTFRASAIDSSGKIYAGGLFSTYTGTTQNGIIRFNSDGSKDTSFVIGNGFSSTDVRAIVPQSDGKILVAGGFTSYSGISANRIIRLNDNGSKDDTFIYGTGFNQNVLTAIVQGDGKIMAGGSFTTYSGISVGRIIRLNSDGSHDNTFDSTVGFTGGNVNAIAVQSDGKYVVVGTFPNYSGVTGSRIIRLNTNGTVDTSFNVGGTGFDATTAVSVEIQPDGKILVGGTFTSYNGVGTYRGLIRLNSNGSSDMCSFVATPTPTPTLTSTPTPSAN